MTGKPDCIQVQTASLRWFIGGLIVGLIMLAKLLWSTSAALEEFRMTNKNYERTQQMHHTAIGEIARGCCPPEVRQSISDIFFNAAQAGETH